MDPDVLLREFLKATADPSNRHLAARQFLTESASNGWDDAGSALLIDRVVFVETRGPERVSVTMRADILGSLSDVGVFETGEGALPDPGPIDLVKTPGGWRIDRLPNGVFLDWQQFQETYKRNTLYFADPDRQDRRARSPLCRGVGSRPAGHRTRQQADRGPAAGDGQHRAQPARPASAPARTGDPRRRRQDGCRPRLRRRAHRPGESVDHRSTQPPTACRTGHLDAVAGRGQGPYVINADGAALDDRFADGWQTSDVAATDPGAADGAAAGLHALVGGSLVALDGRGRHGCPARSVRHRTRRRRRVAQRAGGGVGGDAAARARRTWRRRCGSARSATTRCRRWTVARCRGRPGPWTTPSGWWWTATTSCARCRTRRASRAAYRSTRRRCPPGSPDRSPTCSCLATAHARRW